MATVVKPAVWDPLAYWRAPARNFMSSARLHLQHMLFQNTLGFLLEKHVEQAILKVPSSPLRVADLACGNAIWLIDLSRELANRGISATLDGFDINDRVFPAPVFLPESITLETLDVFAKPLPRELIGAYDVVHVRAAVSLILNADTEPLLSSVLAMLKPGGWLQWEEPAPYFLVQQATPTREKSACKTLVDTQRPRSDKRGCKSDYLAELDQHLARHKFGEVYMTKTFTRKEDYRGWTDDCLMIWEDYVSQLPSKDTDPQADLTKEFWAEHLTKAVVETEKGVALHPEAIFMVVGRKPVENTTHEY
ncbi:S-adenosyl-L-methionine-dependent methyltransferase [Xylaria sp. FL0933]|nr:S-adenosyl-L-methionine-dependent methyltransferase [Xylaria sp. FL0933]